MLSFFKKKTREELIADRIETVVAALTSTNDIALTDLETVQVLNNVRCVLSHRLKDKKSELISQSVDCNQKAVEVRNALLYLK